MTIQGAIAELKNLLEVDDVPFYYKVAIKKVIETISMELADRKTENCSEIPNNSTISKMEQVDKDINVRSKDEPKTQTETQKSNLSFEKDECAKEYEELGLKELKELIEADRKDEPQTDCYMCKWLGEVDVCGRCRNRNLFAEADTEPRCPKCGKRGYIRSLESMGVKLKVFDEYKWKCTNCNKYFKEEPKYEPQTDGYMTAEQTDDYLKMLDKAEHNIYGNIYAPIDEPQTDCDHKCIQTEIGCEKTDCAWK